MLGVQFPLEVLMAKLSPAVKFGLAVGVSLMAGWRPLLDTFELALSRTEYTHLFLILPISVALVWTEWPHTERDSQAADPLGVALLVTALLIALSTIWSPSSVRLSLAMLALVLWWLGAFMACFGTGVFNALLLPLCFLFWLVPIPVSVLDEVVWVWQRGSALSASLLFSAVDVPVTQNGVILSIPGLTVEVAQECSSLRSSLMLIVTSMVLAHLFLRSGWRKSVVVLAAIPLSIAKNGIRIFTLAMLGTRVDPGYLHGNLHRHGGVVFFLLALFAVLLVLWLLQRGENRVIAIPVEGRPTRMRPQTSQQ
jgi:exosortase